MSNTNYVIPENPIYDAAIRALQNTDPAQADTILNPLSSQMINNTHANKLSIDTKANQAEVYLKEETKAEIIAYAQPKGNYTVQESLDAEIANRAQGDIDTLANAKSYADEKTGAFPAHTENTALHTSAEEKAKIAADIAGLADGKLSISQNIPEAADLNDYCTAGMYWYVGDYTNLQNRPPVPSVSFSLLVEKTGAYGTGVAQTATYYHDASRWVRTINDVNVWTAWEQLANMNDIANKTSTMATITQAKFDDLNITTSYVASVNPTIANMPESSHGIIMGYAYAADTSSANGAQEIITSNNTRYYRKAVNGTVSPWIKIATDGQLNTVKNTADTALATANTKMPVTGGTFTGGVVAPFSYLDGHVAI